MNTITHAYFSAEIGLNNQIKTYSGGLGILAGDTIKAMADLSHPTCAVTLLYKHGFFKQKINEENIQVELADCWEYEKLLTKLDTQIIVNIYGQDVIVEVWKYEYEGVSGHKVPIYFLDTNHESNSEFAQSLTHHLYVGDRIAQEIVLGIGGVRVLEALEHPINIYHMNEGHSAFLTLELYKRYGKLNGVWNNKQVQEHCVFTTHTPIPAGHDHFEYHKVEEALKGEEDILPLNLRELAGSEIFNTTQLAMTLSKATNAVSQKHKDVTKEMFPGFEIMGITNGIHAPTWVHPKMAQLFDKYSSTWRYNSTDLKDMFKIPNSQLYSTHQEIKDELIEYVNEKTFTPVTLKKDVLTIGFARRFIEYKDAELIFYNMGNLIKLGTQVQFIFAGKAHMNDTQGKEIMQRIIQHAKDLKDHVSIAFMEDYGIDVTKKMVSGCDMWLNTPIPPNEASGTSGMKAAVNGCLHFSRIDGWAIESFKMNGGGFPMYEYADFITALRYKIIPMFYDSNKSSWVGEMKLSIANSGSFFNTHRMVKEYIEYSYNKQLE
ncbi:MAG: alpha-glucan family phosphorylase [Candidatus Nanoarchaeia archaeon]